MSNINKDEKYNNIYCTPATLRKCHGVIIKHKQEHLSMETLRNILCVFESLGYNIYFLRHKESDTSYPNQVSLECRGSVMFGYFITKGRMKFTRNMVCKTVMLSIKNSTYYKFNNIFEDTVTTEVYFHDSSSISISEFIENDEEIINIIRRLYNVKTVITGIKRRYKNKERLGSETYEIFGSTDDDSSPYM